MITEKEYKYLFEYTGRHYSRYYDVQHEVIDHLASMIEDIRESNPSIGFKSALNIAYKSMPGKEFDKVIDEKEKSLKKYWQRQIGKYLLEYLQWPLMLKTIGLTMTIYLILTLFSSYIFAGLGLILILIFGVLGFFIWRSLKEKEDQYLSLNAFLKVATGAWFLPIYVLNHIDILQRFLSFELYVKIIASLVISVFLILTYIVFVIIPNKIREDVFDRYESLIPVTT